MITRTFTLTTLHGETDQPVARAWWDANQAALQANDVRDGNAPEPTQPLVCDVLAVFRDADGGRLEMHFKDWAEVADLTEGVSATITIHVAQAGS
jgi:hypothetical protein